MKLPPKPCRRAATGAADLANSSGRIVRYLFSDPSVARDNHTISAWKLGHFEANPVFLWAHQADEPPIGRIVEIIDQKGFLRGAVEYCERDIYPFADTIFQLVRGGFLNAVSVSWEPIEWAFTTDRSRPGGVDFKLAELLEVSQVPVPALPTALATARAEGIDTGPLFAWAERILDLKPRGLLIPRKTLEQLRKEAKMPARAKKPAAVITPAPAAPVVPTEAQPAALTQFRRGLYEVAQLAYALNNLGGIQASAEWEAAIEEDGSTVPEQLKGALKALGAALVAMTAEEVAELVDDTGEGSSPDIYDMGVRYVLKTEQRISAQQVEHLKTAISLWTAGKTLVLEPGLRLFHLQGDQQIEIGVPAPAEPALSRAGRVISAANAKHLREAHESIDRGCSMIRSFLDDNGDPCDPEDGDPDCQDERAARERLARVHALEAD